MRPALLNPLFVEASKLRGVGPKVAAALDRLLGSPSRPARVLDLAFHLPVSAVDRSQRGRIAEAPRDQVVTLMGRVREHIAPPSSKAPFRAVIEDESGDCTLVFFRNNASWVEKALPLGSTRWISGRLELYDGRLQMVHPDRVMDAEALKTMPAVEPVYPLTEGLFPRRAGEQHRGGARARTGPARLAGPAPRDPARLARVQRCAPRRSSSEHPRGRRAAGAGAPAPRLRRTAREPARARPRTQSRQGRRRPSARRRRAHREPDRGRPCPTG